MTFCVTPSEGRQPETRRRIDIFCRSDPAFSRGSSDFHSPAFPSSPKVITLLCYEPSCATQRQDEQSTRLPRLLRQQRADAGKCLGLLHGFRNPAAAD